MISCIVLLAGRMPQVRPEQLVRSLAALVPGVVEGLFGDAVLVGTGITPTNRTVAEHAGCEIVDDGADPWGIALGRVLHPAVFALSGGFVPEDGFVDEIRGAMQSSPHLATACRLREQRSGVLSWRGFPGAAVVGLLASRSALARAATGAVPELSRVTPARDLRVRARRAS